jgi:starvation-inducible outer membrane lipoprotein
MKKFIPFAIITTLVLLLAACTPPPSKLPRSSNTSLSSLLAG